MLVAHSEVTQWDAAAYGVDGGRTWIVDSAVQELDEMYILGEAHLALHPSLTLEDG